MPTITFLGAGSVVFTRQLLTDLLRFTDLPGVAACLPHLDVFLPNAAEAVAIARSLGADPTGAGDSFDAGFLCAWLAGNDLGTAVQWGTAAGSLSTRGAGGTGGQATLVELTAALAATSGPAHAR